MALLESVWHLKNTFFFYLTHYKYTYMPWLLGVFHIKNYTTGVRGSSEFTNDKHRAEGKEFIGDKLLQAIT